MPVSQMSVNEILRKQAGKHSGFMPTTVSHTSLTTKDLRELAYKRLRIIPAKVSAYFDRDKIVSVHKSTCAKNPLDNYYIITATDGTLFHVEY